jgi:hypothetical protein
MLTLTAPGVTPDHLRYVQNWDGRSLRPVCGCETNLQAGLGLWNASAGSRWNRMRTALSDSFPGLSYFRAVEVQKRGALHLHVIVWFPAAPDPRALQSFALAAGFGCSTDWAPAEPGSRRFAYYVAKYATKSCDERNDVPWIAPVADRETGEIRPMMTVPTYRTWSSSQNWGLTIKECRDVVRAAAVRRAADLELVRSYLAGAGELETAGSVSSGPEPPS